MKSITVSLLTLIMCFASQANAETTSERSNSMPLANTLQQIEQRLQLSEQQKQKAFPVFKKAQKQRQQVFKEYGIGLGTKPDLSLWQKISLGKSMKN
ncbi:hypothetical protein [Pleionea sp. CnH1-48]|uniref:hypothetical protein n=1 Tax=Pleionea sp. CnH1-48 TaxID=2954494 RepID=UPI0020980AAE|nr:hypothetical protein [Pleionea sp. CnH1-48]MCO7224418.1 hypothetical protein [Pleionea sp. CnH1-48]